MRQALLTKWLEALRSGKFKQTQMTLMQRSPSKHASSFCCLGVLCRVAGLNISTVARQQAEEASLDEPGGFLSTKALERVGLTEEQMYKLSSLNDQDRLTFVQIADAIERNPSEYVTFDPADLPVQPGEPVPADTTDMQQVAPGTVRANETA